MLKNIIISLGLIALAIFMLFEISRVVYFFAILFFIAPIVVGIFDIKNRELKGIDKLKTFFIYLYFGVTLSSFVLFIFINKFVSLVIILQAFMIFAISMIITKKEMIVGFNLLILSIVGMIISICKIINVQYSIALYVILGIGIYLLPLCCYLSRRNMIVKKIKTCTQEVEAKIIKVVDGYIDRGIGTKKVYIPQFEFMFNDKKYKFRNSSEFYFREKINVGDTVRLFINPNNPNIPKHDNGNCEDIFLPDSYKEYQFAWAIKLFYILVSSMLALVIILNFID